MLGCLQVKGRSQWGERLKRKDGGDTQSWDVRKERIQNPAGRKNEV